MEEISDKIRAIMQVVRITIEDKAFKVLNKGLDLLEQLTISNLLECDLGFQVFIQTLVQNDILFFLCCRAEDNMKKIKEKCVDALMILAYNEKIGSNLIGDQLFKRVNEHLELHIYGFGNSSLFKLTTQSFERLLDFLWKITNTFGLAKKGSINC